MSITKEQLEEFLARTPKTPADAEKAARAAQALAVYLRAEEAAAEVLAVDGSPSPEGGSFDNLTLHDAAERVLEEAGVPLHVRELGKRIKAAGWRHKRSRAPRPDQINYQLASRLSRHADVFVRVAPNTFALRSWRRLQRPEPRLGLFRSGTTKTSRQIGEHPEGPASDGPWRSS